MYGTPQKLPNIKTVCAEFIPLALTSQISNLHHKECCRKLVVSKNYFNNTQCFIYKMSPNTDLSFAKDRHLRFCHKYLTNNVEVPPAHISGPRQLSRYSDWPWAGRSGDGNPVGARFSAPVQTSPGAHPASCTMGTGSFTGGKECPERDADPSPPF
jgi:hypothetical protein